MGNPIYRYYHFTQKRLATRLGTSAVGRGGLQLEAPRVVLRGRLGMGSGRCHGGWESSSRHQMWTEQRTMGEEDGTMRR